jgi:hypothetical protein
MRASELLNYKNFVIVCRRWFAIEVPRRDEGWVEQCRMWGVKEDVRDKRVKLRK